MTALGGYSFKAIIFNMDEFSKTKRGARSLHYNGFQYTINRRGRDGQTYCGCINRSFQRRATTDANDDVVAENNDHDHPPETAKATVAEVVDKMKEQMQKYTFHFVYSDSIMLNVFVDKMGVDKTVQKIQ